MPGDRSDAVGHYPNVLRKLLSLVGVATVVTACSASYMYEFAVTISEEVILEDDPPLRFVESHDPFLEDAPKTYAGEHDYEKTAARTYEGESAACCNPNGETVYLFAYIDLNRNDSWDPGEPWGEDPNNPVEIDDDGYRSEILVEPDAEEQ